MPPLAGAAISALEALATAVFSALVGDAAFSALSPIYNHVPQGTLAPYTVLENFTEAPWNTMHEFGKTCTFQLHTVSQAFGDQEGLRIQSAGRTVLDYQKLTLTNGLVMVDCKFETADHWKEDAIGGVLTRHHVSVYRVLVAQP